MENEYYEPPHYKNEGGRGETTVFVLGLLSLLAVFVLDGLGIVAFILGIISVVKGNALKREGVDTSLVRSGWVMGLIGLIISSIKLFLIIFVFGFAIATPLITLALI